MTNRGAVEETKREHCADCADSRAGICNRHVGPSPFQDAARTAGWASLEEEIRLLREELAGAVEERDELAEQLEQAEARYYAIRDDRDRLQVLADALKRGQ